LLACRDDNIDLLKVLVEHGVNLDVEDANGLNIVHYAAQSIGTDVLSYLFETHLQSTHHTLQQHLPNQLIQFMLWIQ
jgi:ankyrin repeat protein